MSPLSRYQYPGSPPSRIRIFVLLGGLLLFSCLFGQGFFVNALVFQKPNRAGVVLMCGLACLAFFTTNSNSILLIVKSKYSKLIILSLLCIGFSTWATPCLQFGISIWAIPIAVGLHLGILSLYVLAVYANDDRSFKAVHWFVLGISIIFLLIQVLGALAPSLYYTVFASSRMESGVSITRGAAVRLLMPSTIGVFVAYSFCYSIVKSISNPIKNYPWILFIVLYFMHLLFVRMGRRLILASVVLVIIAALMERNVAKAAVYYVIIALLGTAILLFVPGVYEQGVELTGSVYDEIQGGSTRGTTVGIRLEGVSFWTSLFFETGCVGLGKVVPDMVPGNCVLAFADVEEGYKFSDLHSLEIFLRYGFHAVLATAILYFCVFRDISAGLKTTDNPSHYHMLRGLRLFTVFQLIGQSSLYWNVATTFPWGVVLYMVWYLTPQQKK